MKSSKDFKLIVFSQSPIQHNPVLIFCLVIVFDVSPHGSFASYKAFFRVIAAGPYVLRGHGHVNIIVVRLVSFQRHNVRRLHPRLLSSNQRLEQVRARCNPHSCLLDYVAVVKIPLVPSFPVNSSLLQFDWLRDVCRSLRVELYKVGPRHRCVIVTFVSLFDCLQLSNVF